MRYFSHFTTPFIVSLLLAEHVFAQTRPVDVAPTKDGEIADMTDTTMPSPSATAASPQAPAAPAQTGGPAPQPPPAAVAAAPPPPAPRVQPILVATPDQPAPDLERVRQGFYFRMVSAPAFVSMSGTGRNGDAKISGLGDASVIALGGSVAPGFVIAGMLQATQLTAKFNGGPYVGTSATTADGRKFDVSNQATASAMGFGLLLDWYPNPSGGWHAGLAGGLGVIAVQNLADNSQMAGGGLTGRLFGGYDFAIGKAWSLGLGLSLSAVTSSKLKDADDTTIDTGYRLKSVSVGFDASILFF